MSTGNQIAGGVIGAALSAVIPGVGVALGAQLGIMLGSMFDPAQVEDGPQLSDRTVQTATLGADIGRVHGTVGVTGNVFWVKGGEIQETPHKKKTGKGGKKTVQRTFTYSASFAVGLCEGPIAGVKRVWVGADLIYSADTTDIDSIIASNAAQAMFRVYTGSDTQMPDPVIQADIGVEDTPAWRGIAYIVFYDLQLANYGDSLVGAQVKVEVATSLTEENYAISTAMPMPGVGVSHYYGLVWDGAKWCTISSLASNLAMYSYDSTNWVVSSALPVVVVGAGTVNWHKLLFNGKRYITIGGTLHGLPSEQHYCASSHDMVTWVVTPLPGPGIGWSPRPTLGGSGNVLITGSEAVGGPYYAMYTNDGLTFSDVQDIGFRVGNSCTWTGEVFVAANSQTIWDAGGYFLVFYPYMPPTQVLFPTGWMANNVRVKAKGGDVLAIGYRDVGGLPVLESCVSSDNGATWSTPTVVPFPPTGSAGFSDPGASTTEWCLVCNEFAYWLTSPDGVMWSRHDYTGGALDDTVRHSEPVWNGLWGTVGIGLHFIRSIFLGAHVGSDTATTLSELVQAECARSDALPDVIVNTSTLTDVVRGYFINGRMSIRSAIEPLRTIFPYDIVEKGYQIHFVRRGGTPSFTIADGDLDAGQAGSEPGVRITVDREMSESLPSSVYLKYKDASRDYADGEQYAERPNTSSLASGDMSYEIPIVLTSAEAAQAADIIINLMWLERSTLRFNLPALEYGALEPSDVGTLPTSDGPAQVRLIEVNYSTDSRVECTAKYNHAPGYTSIAVGSASVVTGSSTVKRRGLSAYVVMDIPRVSSAQDSQGVVVAMYAQTSGWPGGSLLRSLDGGATWATSLEFGPPGATLGVSTAVAGDAGSRLWDMSNHVPVMLDSGDIFDVSEAEVFNGTNYFAYGAEGRWEIVAAQYVNVQPDDSYILTGLLRGLYGTEWAGGMHVLGDRVILLDSTDLLVAEATLGLLTEYNGVTYGDDVSNGVFRSHTYTGVNLKPLAPVYVAGYKDAVSDDWVIKWDRRSRTDQQWKDYVDVDLGETSEAYQIDIYNDHTFATVVRTLHTTAPSVVYTSADHFTDFGGTREFVACKVYMMSSVVGRGYPASAYLSRIITLTALPTEQASVSPSDAIALTYWLSGTSCVQGVSSGVGSISSIVALTAESSGQSSVSVAGAVSITHNTTSLDSTQASTCSVGAVDVVSVPGSDPFFSNVTLLIQGDTTPPVDVKGHTISSSVISTMTWQMSTGLPSMEFHEGVDALVEMTDYTVEDLGDTDWCLEMMIAGTTGDVGFWTVATTFDNFEVAVEQGDNDVYVLFGSEWLHFTGLPLTDSLPHHLAVVSMGGDIRVYADGVASTDVYTVGTQSISPTSTLNFGTTYQGWMNPANSGGLSHIRLTVGVPRYTSNFTPPTLPLPQF